MYHFTPIKEFDTIFSHLDKLCWNADINDENIYEIAKRNFKNIVKNKTKNGLIFRTIGQSGSGKTTQLFPSVDNFCKKNNIKYVHFAVRNFASLHPDYENLFKTFGKKEIREKTNAFALKCLLISLVFAIENHYDIVFEVTLLSKSFENFVLKTLNKFNYKKFYFCIATNYLISDCLINKRMIENVGDEKGRVIYKSSSLFFYSALKKSIKFLSKKDKESLIVVWNVFDELPIYFGKISLSVKKILEEQKIIKFDFKDPGILSQFKKDFLIKSIKL